MAEALSDNCWEHSVLVGVSAKSGTSQEGCGIIGDPARVILEDDVAIFICKFLLLLCTISAASNVSLVWCSPAFNANCSN